MKTPSQVRRFIPHQTCVIIVSLARSVRIHLIRKREKTALARDGCCTGEYKPIQANLAPSHQTKQTDFRSITAYADNNAKHGTFRTNLASQGVEGARDSHRKRTNDRARRANPTNYTTHYRPPTEHDAACSDFLWKLRFVWNVFALARQTLFTPRSDDTRLLRRIRQDPRFPGQT